MKELVETLVSKGSEPKYFDDVIHVQKEYGKSKPTIDIFYFPFGCITIWGAEESQEKNIVEELENFELERVEEISSDLIYYHYDLEGPKTFIDEEKNDIILNSNLAFVKLSISHALAQSVKLNILEASVTKLIEKTAPLQKELASKGSVSLTKTEISKQIGVLFNERYSINMHSDILDVPQFFWRRPSYEPLYLMTVEFQDIQLRQNIMNHRLDLINDLYGVLSNELNYRHSTRLEIIIIVLIAIEVLVALTSKDIWQKFAALFGI
jgi:uncharacterized Rmd1/YagE family protein